MDSQLPQSSWAPFISVCVYSQWIFEFDTEQAFKCKIMMFCSAVNVLSLSCHNETDLQPSFNGPLSAYWHQDSRNSSVADWKLISSDCTLGHREYLLLFLNVALEAVLLIRWSCSTKFLGCIHMVISNSWRKSWRGAVNRSWMFLRKRGLTGLHSWSLNAFD